MDCGSYNISSDTLEEDFFYKDLKQLFSNYCCPKIYIFGTGQGGLKLFEYLNPMISKHLLDIKLCGFIDNDMKKNGTKFYGLNVINPQEYLNEILEADYIFIASVSYSREISAQLISLGIYEDKIIKLSPFFFEFLLTSQMKNPFYIKSGIRINEEKIEKRKNIRNNYKKFMDSEDILTFSVPPKPVLSIIIVLWNQADLTFYCLENLANNKEVDYELIIIDNASSDETPKLLQKIKGPNIIINDINLGFLKAVNQGAKKAKGKFLLFLNNDAVLQSGSLKTAVEILESSVNVGAVGGKIVLPDQTLQEAGSIIWNDATCQGYMRGYKPVIGEVMFQRNVDYCSGACLFTKKALFEKIGGFDEAFAPAYYEETDYCLRLREKGYRILYEPCIIIEHYEFGSSENSDFSRNQMQINRELLKTKHAQFLSSKEYLPPSKDNILLSRMRNCYKGRILVIDENIPICSLGAGYPRANKLVKSILKENWFVTCYPLKSSFVDWNEVYQDLPETVEVIQCRGAKEILQFLVERKNYYNKILISRPDSMSIFTTIIKNYPELFYGVELIYDAEAICAFREIMEERLLGKKVSKNLALQRINEELSLAESVNKIIAVSDYEASVFRNNSYNNVYVLGHSLKANPTSRSFKERKDILFVGRLVEEGTPNVDSVFLFVNEIFPKILKDLGEDVLLNIVGKNDAPTIQKLIGKNNINVMGMVDNLTEIYNNAKIFIAPTRYAAGIPYKIHEAASYGLPVVATNLLTKQLNWENGIDILAANDAESFAAKCVELYTNEKLWNNLRNNAINRISKENDESIYQKKVKEILNVSM